MIENRITAMLGVEKPIVQAPMGYIARAQLASAVSEAGGLGIIETSSGELDAVKEEIRKMRDLTDKPFGVNIAQAFVRDPGITDFVDRPGRAVRDHHRPATRRSTPKLKEAGLTVFHVVPSLNAALKAVDAGVDGLVVEGGEGGGFKNPRDVATMVLLPLVRSKIDVPIIAAGGIADGASMAAAFALGAEGVQMGTRMVSAAESPVHDNWKQAIIDSAETDTVFLNRLLQAGPARAAHRSGRIDGAGGQRDGPLRRRDGDSTSAATWRPHSPFGGQVAGRIESIEPVALILDRTDGRVHHDDQGAHPLPLRPRAPRLSVASRRRTSSCRRHRAAGPRRRRRGRS